MRLFMHDDVLTHFWLKPPNSEDDTFHVYLDTSPGTASLCHRSPAIHNMLQMDIPGDRSKCCLHCFSKLYGFNPYSIIRNTQNIRKT